MASLKKRGETYYIQFCLAGKKQQRINLKISSYYVAKDKLRQFESQQAMGEDHPFPTRTPISKVLEAYVQHIRNAKTPKSAQTDIYLPADPLWCRYRCPQNHQPQALRQAQETSTCYKTPALCAESFEQISTAQIATFISGQMAARELAPKTANRFRDTCSALFTWAMTQFGIKLPNNRNPAAGVAKYQKSAPQIQFLTLKQVNEQMTALDDQPQMQAMVATLIYAGLRREELLWLTHDDIDWSARRPIFPASASASRRSNSVQPPVDLRQAVAVQWFQNPHMRQPFYRFQNPSHPT